MSRVMVTGGAGFIGSHLVDALLLEGHEVVCMDDLSTGKMENLKWAARQKGFKFLRMDVAQQTKGWLSGVDIVYHLAAAKKTACLADPLRDGRVNALGTLKMLERTRESYVPRFVLVSTGSVYGESTAPALSEDLPTNPVSIYGVSKLAAEGYARAYAHIHGMRVCILRYFHVYGPRQDSSERGGVVAIFTRQILAGDPLTVFGDGQQERTFTYVGDVVRATLAAAEWAEADCPTLNVSSGRSTTILELAAMLSLLTGRSTSLRFGPPTVGDIRRFCVSNARLLGRGFAFQTDLQAGLAETIRWYRDREQR